jgi:hypothetical protein
MSILSEMPPIEWRPSATIQPFADGTWQPTPEQPDPDPSVPECMLYQIEETDGSLYDVVAWESARPHIWWLRYGRATFMGEWCINKANHERKPVWLVPTPAEYLQYAPLACCILRWDADIRAILSLADHRWICTNPALWRRATEASRERRSIHVDLVA